MLANREIPYISFLHPPRKDGKMTKHPKLAAVTADLVHNLAAEKLRRSDVVALNRELNRAMRASGAVSSTGVIKCSHRFPYGHQATLSLEFVLGGPGGVKLAWVTIGFDGSPNKSEDKPMRATVYGSVTSNFGVTKTCGAAEMASDLPQILETLIGMAVVPAVAEEVAA